MENLEDIKTNDGISSTEKEPKIRASFAVVLNNKGEVLLHLRSDGTGWDLPGGRRNRKTDGSWESPEETLFREVEEETGLKVKTTGISKKFVNREKGRATMVYVCQIQSGEIQISPESIEVRFFPLDQLPENLLAKQKERILEVLAARGVAA